MDLSKVSDKITKVLVTEEQIKALQSEMEGNGEVTGIIPEVLLEWEHEHKGITDLRVVADMHVRKKMLYELCDADIILPGGNGTLDELFEMLTWNTLKIHNKKIVILNCNGYYERTEKIHGYICTTLC